MDAYLQDQTVFSKSLPSDFDTELELATLQGAEDAVARAATTELEYKLVKQIVEYSNAVDAKAKMSSAEMSYSRTYRLRWQDHVHKGINHLRAQVLKKAAKKKQSSGGDSSEED